MGCNGRAKRARGSYPVVAPFFSHSLRSEPHFGSESNFILGLVQSCLSHA